MPPLTEQEQQEIIRFLEADKPLPEKYRFLLFDTREVVGTTRFFYVGWLSLAFDDYSVVRCAAGGLKSS